MFHLFDRFYLEREEWYSSKYPHLILSLNEIKHPASRQTDFDLGMIPPFEKLLEEHFEGKEEVFWIKMLETEGKYILFLDDELFFRFKVCYWKSVLKHNSPENLYKLYLYDFLDSKLKKYLYNPMVPKYESDHQEKVALTFEEFCKKNETIEINPVFSQMDKRRVGFELLLANYYLGENYQAAFIERLKTLSWEAWFEDMEIMRSEIINSFYDLKRILPDRELNLLDVNATEKLISSELSLSWILDPNFASRDIEYVKSHYSKEIFLQLGQTVLKLVDGKIKLKDESVRDQIVLEEHILPTEYVFEDRYIDLLQKDIDKGFGCKFVSNDLNDRANQILPLFVYDQVRNKRISELSFLELN